MPVPARIRCSEEAKPPPAGTPTSAPSGSARKVSGPRLDTTTVALCWLMFDSGAPGQRAGRDPFERGAQDVDRLRA